MTHQYPDKMWEVLRCPNCCGQFDRMPEGVRCLGCGIFYKYTASGVLDLRLARPKNVQLLFSVGNSALPVSGVNFDSPSMNPHPQVDFSGIKGPVNVSKKVMSYLPKAKDTNSLMLDLGCGNAAHRTIIEHAGYQFVGLDYSHPDAPLLGDAQALPFDDNSFDFVWSAAMWQYVQFPFVMIHEVFRVLKPQGKFLGIVGTLEPFDGQSFYMYTRLGILNLLHYGGFEVERITPDDWWTALTALSRMGLFPRMPGSLSKALVSPLDALGKLWWRVGSLRNKNSTDAYRLAHVTAAHSFVAVKP